MLHCISILQSRRDTSCLIKIKFFYDQFYYTVHYIGPGVTARKAVKSDQLPVTITSFHPTRKVNIS